MDTARSTHPRLRLFSCVLLGAAPIGCQRDPLDDGGVVTGDTRGSSTTLDSEPTDGATSSTSAPTSTSSPTSPDGTDTLEPTTSVTDETTSAEDTATVTTCGDGILDPGETCDDGNVADDDGCSASCQDEACTLDWWELDPIGSWTQTIAFTPMLLANDELVIAHRFGEGEPVDTRISWASTADGALLSTVDVVQSIGNDFMQSLAMDPSGDVFLGSTDTSSAEVRRISPDGTEQWAIERLSETWVGGLELNPQGELVMVTQGIIGSGQADVVVSAHDPTTGAEVWSHAISGRAAPDGSSDDFPSALVMDDGGRAFVSYADGIDAITSEAWVVALSPSGDPIPLWQRPILALDGELLLPWRLALGPDGLLVALVIASGPPRNWVIGLDADTGDQRWIVSSEDLESPEGIDRGWVVAVSSERVLVAGTGNVEMPAGTPVSRTFVLGIDLEGNVVCNDFVASQNVDRWTPLGIAVGPNDEFYLGGYRYPLDDPGERPYELFRMRIR